MHHPKPHPGPKACRPWVHVQHIERVFEITCKMEPPPLKTGSFAPPAHSSPRVPHRNSRYNFQCIRTFMLARVTPRALSALPGVFIIMPTKKSGGGKRGGGGKAETDPELVGSNVLSVGEGVLLKWLSYHLEQANRVSE